MRYAVMLEMPVVSRFIFGVYLNVSVSQDSGKPCHIKTCLVQW
jgi:hypothetical protein